MWELDCEEGWAPKNWCFWTMVLDKTLESPLDCKEIQPVHPKGVQSWVFIGRTGAKAETPILWPPHAKSWVIGKDSDAGKDWGQEEKGTTEDEMAGWHHWLDGRESEWTPGVGDGQGGLACFDHGVAKSWTRLSDWTELKDTQHGKIQSTKAFWILLMVLTTSPEVSWTCSQGSLVIISQGTEKLLLLIPSFHLGSSWKPTDSIRIFSTCVSSFDGRVLVCLLQTKIIVCRLWFQKDARPFLSIWNLQVLLWLRKEMSVYTHGGNLPTFPSSLLSPGFSLTLSFPLRVGTQKGTLLHPLHWAFFPEGQGQCSI